MSGNSELLNHKKRVQCRLRLRVSGLTQSFIYQPLAVLLAILLAPSLSWFETGIGNDSGSNGAPFEASAQIVIGGCHPQRPNSIIQVVCPGGQLFAPDLYQLESDAVTAYLNEHNLPSSDAHFIYDEGRMDLRSAIRATMFAGLLAIINKPASQRSAHEQNLYNWMQYLVQQNEIAEYTQAINQYNSWESNPCGFKLDPNIASEYGLSYNGALFCASPLNQILSGPPVPAESYFLAYGLANSYGAPGQMYSYFPTLVAQTQLNVGEIFGIGMSAGALVASAASGLIAAFSSSIFPTALGSNVPELLVAGEWVAGDVPLEIAETASVAGGVAAIILVAVAIGVTAGMQAFSNQQTINDLNNLSNTLNQVANNKPDLGAFATDSTGLGQSKLNETFVAQTVPGAPSSATLPAHQAGTDPSFAIAPSGGSAASSDVLNYQDWNGLNWTAQTYGGWFVQTCNSGAGCSQTDSLIANINYVDWSGTKWTASRIGYNFVSTKGAPASTDQACPADEASGVSPGSDFSKCISYVSSSIPLKDSSGNPVSVSLTVKPAFTSSAALYFTTGHSSTDAITAAGAPVPDISVSGNLPAGFSFSQGNGTASVAYDGTAPEGTYQATLTASNGYSSVTQTLTINVITQLSITSPSVLTGLSGVPVNFLVTTTGDLPIKLSIDLDLLQFSGLTFTDNGNGTATIKGTPGDIAAVFCITSTGAPCGITATNATGSVTQGFAVSLTPPPQATLVGPPNVTFSAGNPNSVRLVSTGAITPVRWHFDVFGLAPSWVSFHDNGDGTGILSGTPPTGTTGSFTFSLLPVANGTIPIISTNFTVNVADIPGFLTPNVATFTAGTSGTFEIQTDGPAVDDGGATLPAGLTFNSGNPATITGTPAAGTGGTYTLPLTATDSRGTGSQLLALNIYEAPKITSTNLVNFRAGAKSSFQVTTLGYPSVSNQQNPTAVPSSPDEGLGMHFTVEGALPAGFTASNLNPQNFATGTLTIQGTPTQENIGVHRVDVTATNGVGAPVTQQLFLNVLQTPAPAPSSSNTCDGTYGGTFNGTIDVQPGQSCTFFGGHITGNVLQDGGTLTLHDVTIDGSVAVRNTNIGDGFSLINNAIAGSLSISNVMPGPAPDQACANKVGSYMRVENNRTTIQVGAGCPSNTIGDYLNVANNNGMMIVENNAVTTNLMIEHNNGGTQVNKNRVTGSVTIQDNTVSTQVNNNTVAANLTIGHDAGITQVGNNTVTGNVTIQDDTGSTQVNSDKIGGILNCTNNQTITGGHDTATQKLGQCAAF